MKLSKTIFKLFLLSSFSVVAISCNQHQVQPNENTINKPITDDSKKTKITNISFEKVAETSVSVFVFLKNLDLKSNNKIYIQINNNKIEMNAFDSQESKASFLVKNLTENTEYTVEKAFLNSQQIELSKKYSFKTKTQTTEGIELPIKPEDPQKPQDPSETKEPEKPTNPTPSTEDKEKPQTPDDQNNQTDNKNPALSEFAEKFSLSLNDVFDTQTQKYKEASSIQTATNLYKTSLKEFKTFLKTENIDFSNYNENQTDRFFEKLQNVGIYGDFGENDEEKIKYFTDGYRQKWMTTAKYLENFDVKQQSQNLNSQTLQKLKEFISKNPFGLLPSNLSQFLYFLNLDSIQQLFSIESKLSDVKANFDDKKGEITLLFKTEKGDFLYYLNKQNSDLKSDNDFYSFINDRTFSIAFDYLVIKQQNFEPYPKLHKANIGGTAWILDRITNAQNRIDGVYDFIVGTNAHVINFGDFFDKSQFFFDPNESTQKSKDWYGGFDFNAVPKVEDVTQNNRISHQKITNLPQQNHQWLTRVTFAKNNYNSSYDFEQNIYNRPELTYSTFNLWREWKDMLLYTPFFASEGVKTKRDVADIMLNKGHQNRIGTTPYGGGDFVLIKIRLTKAEIQRMFPSLYDVLDTDKEKDWYLGLGNENSDSKELENPTKTHFVGGYPLYFGSSDYKFAFKVAKSNGGTIIAKNRIIDNKDFVNMWTKYDEQKNKEYNSLNEDWKKYQKPFVEGVDHGMRIRIINQMPILNLNNSKSPLDSGSSGSMVIDSKFNLIGVNFAHVYAADHKEEIGNSVALFKSPIKYSDSRFSGDIKQDFVKILKDKNIQTIKLNSAN
ncbi:MAG2960 family serine endopeptidase lipoprotein [Mycoplasma procyoni]|uniref:MAG2960 family serine endopeptidase lipoprotein n=1 Tax=Mycoplasma procyoni TaxID=568784 RepID=UPI00197CA0E3|nr:hypothetical protein [Mycoplasma procyoni]MBN3534594.1 hypothetical protein [Mycoplasma procyoni]